MKKLLAVTICFILASSILNAQDYPDFGMPSKEEFELKECSFDKHAGAVVLIHEAFSYSEDGMQLITTHHVRIKILKKTGTDAANITIPFFRINYFERIINLQALTINVAEDGTILKQKVTKKSIYTTKVNDYIGQINFTFPDVKEGSIIEYQYQSTMKNYWGLQDWYFQQEIPVMVSRYHLKILWDKRFNYQVIKSPGREVTILPEKDKIFFEMRNIPGLSSTSEPYMDAKNDNIQRVNIWVGEYNSRWGTSNQINTFYSSWPLLNRLLLYEKGFGSEIMAQITGTEDIVNKAKALTSEMEKMKLIYNYVRSNIAWNNTYSKFSVAGVNDAWMKRSGSSGDINLILMNLLNKAQLKTYPLLVSQRFNGKVDTAYAYAGQFNSVFVCVQINGQKYILDGTDKYTAATFFPESILNTTTFLIDRLSGELITVLANKMQYKLDINLNIQVADDGLMKGNAGIINNGYARIKKHKEFDKDTIKFRDRYLQQKDITMTIPEYKMLITENDSLPLTENFTFNSTLSRTGNYVFIPANLFTELDKNPFINDNRFSPINFGYNRNVNLNAVIKIPESYTVDGLPENLNVTFSDNNIVFLRQTNYNKSANTITYSLQIEFNKNLYEAAEYPVLKAGYKKIFNLLEEKIVLIKK